MRYAVSSVSGKGQNDSMSIELAVVVATYMRCVSSYRLCTYPVELDSPCAHTITEINKF